MKPVTRPLVLPAVIPVTYPRICTGGESVQVLRIVTQNVGLIPSMVQSYIVLAGPISCYPSSVGVGYIEWNSAVGGLTDEPGSWEGSIPDGFWVTTIRDTALTVEWIDLLQVVGSWTDPSEVLMV